MLVQECRPLGARHDLRVVTMCWVDCDHCGMPGPWNECQSHALEAWRAAGHVIEDYADYISGVWCSTRFACRHCIEGTPVVPYPTWVASYQSE